MGRKGSDQVLRYLGDIRAYKNGFVGFVWKLKDVLSKKAPNIEFLPLSIQYNAKKSSSETLDWLVQPKRLLAKNFVPVFPQVA